MELRLLPGGTFSIFIDLAYLVLLTWYSDSHYDQVIHQSVLCLFNLYSSWNLSIIIVHFNLSDCFCYFVQFALIPLIALQHPESGLAVITAFLGGSW